MDMEEQNNTVQEERKPIPEAVSRVGEFLSKNIGGTENISWGLILLICAAAYAIVRLIMVLYYIFNW